MDRAAWAAAGSAAAETATQERKDFEAASGSDWEAVAESEVAGWVALAEAGLGSEAEVGLD